MKDFHWTRECSTNAVSICSKCTAQSATAECSTWQTGFQAASAARRIQTYNVSTAATAVWPKAKYTAISAREEQ
jgi:hypothetical protein